MKGFAQKLGFKRASDPRFRMLLKQWEIEGAVKVYQGGYHGHSLAHPKKALLTQSVQYFQEKALGVKAKQLFLGEYIAQLTELGFKVQTAVIPSHKCSVCDTYIPQGTNYASASFFLIAKLCGGCAQGLCEGEFSIKPELKIRETIKVELKGE
jgi:hypothetical protein